MININSIIIIDYDNDDEKKGKKIVIKLSRTR